MKHHFFGLISVLTFLVLKETNSVFQNCLVMSQIQKVEITESRNFSSEGLDNDHIFCDDLGNEHIRSAEIQTPFGYQFIGPRKVLDSIEFSKMPDNPSTLPYQRRWVRKNQLKDSMIDSDVSVSEREESISNDTFVLKPVILEGDVLKSRESDETSLKDLKITTVKVLNEGRSDPKVQKSLFCRIKLKKLLSIMPQQTSRLFETFTFKGVGFSISKSVIKWKSTGMGCKIPLSANFPNYDSIAWLPKVGTSIGVRYPFDLTWSISGAIPVPVVVQGLVWISWVIGLLPQHMVEQTRKVKSTGAVQRIGITYSLRFNPTKGIRPSYGPWFYYVPSRKLLDKLLPTLYLLPATILAFVELVIGPQISSWERLSNTASGALNAHNSATSNASESVPKALEVALLRDHENGVDQISSRTPHKRSGSLSAVKSSEFVSADEDCNSKALRQEHHLFSSEELSRRTNFSYHFNEENHPHHQHKDNHTHQHHKDHNSRHHYKENHPHHQHKDNHTHQHHKDHNSRHHYKENHPHHQHKDNHTHQHHKDHNSRSLHEENHPHHHHKESHAHQHHRDNYTYHHHKINVTHQHQDNNSNHRHKEIHLHHHHKANATHHHHKAKHHQSHHRGIDKMSRHSQNSSHMSGSLSRRFDPLAWQSIIVDWTRVGRRNVVLGGRIGLFRMDRKFAPSIAVTLDCQPFFPFKGVVVAALEKLRNSPTLENAASIAMATFRSISKENASTHNHAVAVHQATTLPAVPSIARAARTATSVSNHSSSLSFSSDEDLRSAKRRRTSMKSRMKARYRKSLELDGSNRSLANPQSLSNSSAPKVRRGLAKRSKRLESKSKNKSDSASVNITITGASYRDGDHVLKNLRPPPHISEQKHIQQDNNHTRNSRIDGHNTTHQARLAQQWQHPAFKAPTPSKHQPHPRRPRRKSRVRHVKSGTQMSYWHVPWKRNASSFTTQSNASVEEEDTMHAVLREVISHRHAQLRQLHKSPDVRLESDAPLASVAPQCSKVEQPMAPAESSLEATSRHTKSIQSQQDIAKVMINHTIWYAHVAKDDRQQEQRYASLASARKTHSEHSRLLASDGHKLKQKKSKTARMKLAKNGKHVSYWHVPWKRNASTSTSGLNPSVEEEDAMHAVLREVISHRHAQLRQLHKSPNGRIQSNWLRATTILIGDSTDEQLFDHNASTQSLLNSSRLEECESIQEQRGASKVLTNDTSWHTHAGRREKQPQHAHSPPPEQPKKRRSRARLRGR